MLNRESGRARHHMVRAIIVAALSIVVLPLFAATYGPWNAEVLQGGIGLDAPMPKQAAVLGASADWSAYAWVYPGQASQ
jgi:hypothetical protein